MDFARRLVRRTPAGDRLGRLTAVFTFVSHLVDVPPPAVGEPRTGLDVLIALAGEEEGPALILAALLQALGERASLAQATGFAFVRVEIGLAELRRLPPHARPLATRGRCYLPLDPRDARRPLGFLPAPIWRMLLACPGPLMRQSRPPHESSESVAERRVRGSVRRV